MRVESIRVGEMTDDLWDRWSEMQRANPILSSPYFHPGFCRALRDVGRPVEVGVIHHAGDVIGFLPFERRRFGLGRSAGWPLCDYQGVISAPGWQPDLDRLTAALHLRALDFDHLVAEQTPPRAEGWLRAESPLMDVGGGYQEYIKRRQASGSKLIQDSERQMRKAAREVGEVRFISEVDDKDVFHQLLSWKSQQYLRTGLFDLFSHGWPAGLLQRLMSTGQPDFGCVLSALYFGDRLAAVHLGLRCRQTLHYWFPAYDDRLASYSPGTAALLYLAREGAELGISRIDLGKGAEFYKERFATSSVAIAEGSIVRSGLVRAARDGVQRARWWLGASGSRHALKPLLSWVRRARKSLELS